jgi:hypothetical protein
MPIDSQWAAQILAESGGTEMVDPTVASQADTPHITVKTNSACTTLLELFIIAQTAYQIEAAASPHSRSRVLLEAAASPHSRSRVLPTMIKAQPGATIVPPADS